jgi:hypothetical protein
MTKMSYGCPASKIATDSYLMKLQRRQEKFFPHQRQFPRVNTGRDLDVLSRLPCAYDYIAKLCKQQAEVIRNHENANVCSIGQGEARHRKYKRHKLGGGEA